MDKARAELIVNMHGAAIGADNKLFKKQSSLPVSRDVVRNAYLTFIYELIQDSGRLPEDAHRAFVWCYGLMDVFLEDDEVDRLNANFALRSDTANFNDPEKVKLISEANRKYASCGQTELMAELEGFIQNCYEKFRVK